MALSRCKVRESERNNKRERLRDNKANTNLEKFIDIIQILFSIEIPDHPRNKPFQQASTCVLLAQGVKIILNIKYSFRDLYFTFPHNVLSNAPQHSCTPTKFARSKFWYYASWIFLLLPSFVAFDITNYFKKIKYSTC